MIMEIRFGSDRERMFWQNLRSLTAKYGTDNARKIVRRISELQAADTLLDVPVHLEVHPLDGSRLGQFAVTVKQPFRLIFVPIGECDSANFGTIKVIKIIEITN